MNSRFSTSAFIIIFIMIFVQQLYAQTTIIPPYINNFNNLFTDTVEWDNYTDIPGIPSVWDAGIPYGSEFDEAHSYPYAWCTELSGVPNSNATNHYIETPSFNFVNLPSDYHLAFYYKSHSYNSNEDYFFEFSIDGGNTWDRLNDNNSSYNWQDYSSGFYDYSSFFTYASIKIIDLIGEPDVRFRFRYDTNDSSNLGEGWMIDDFVIQPITRNVEALSHSDTIRITENCHYNIDLDYILNLQSPVAESQLITTNFYLSTDLTLDASDLLIHSETGPTFVYSNSNVSNFNYDTTIDSIPNITAGTYYILTDCNANDNVIESDDSDNIGHYILHVDPVYDLPYLEDCEIFSDDWHPETQYSVDSPIFWQRSAGTKHHIENARSGEATWNTGGYQIGDLEWDEAQSDYLHLPYFDLSNTNNIVFSVWYKNGCDGNSPYWGHLKYSTGCNGYYTVLSPIGNCDDSKWKYSNIDLQSLEGNENVTFRIDYSSNDSYDKGGIAFDDFYIGEAKADLSIEENDIGRYTLSNVQNETLTYKITNSGLLNAGPSTSHFYWSTDEILDINDTFLGSKSEPNFSPESTSLETFSYTKPNNNLQEYYIIYILDEGNSVDEMREYDNTGHIKIRQEIIEICPYYNDFETQINGWHHENYIGNDDWEWGTPSGEILNTAFSGTKTWTTEANDSVSLWSRMHLYSPPLDLSTLNNPVLEFDMKINKGSLTNQLAMNMSYTTDNGLTWQLLDTTNQSFSVWYYSQASNGYSGGEYETTESYNNLTGEYYNYSFSSVHRGNGKNSDNNSKFILDLGFLSGYSNVRFRYNLGTSNHHLSSLGNGEIFEIPQEGAIIDNFSITEKHVDLMIPYSKVLHINKDVSEFRFFVNIKNNGNYISDEMKVKYYLSNDNQLDGSDYFLGEEMLPRIMPDRYAYMNSKFPAPNLHDYSYFIYEIDSENDNAESDEMNNIAAWSLGDNLSPKDYFQDFEATVLNGWSHWAALRSFGYQKEGFRVRNHTAPYEISTYTEQNPYFDGVLANDSQNNYFSFDGYVPIFYMETPPFDFSGIDSVWMSFDLACTGINNAVSSLTDGGNLEFSLDGGNSWILLYDQSPDRLNWYPTFSFQILEVFNQKGWFDDGNNLGQGPPSLPRGYNLSFLKGNDNVQFRFKYSSYHHHYGAGSYQGFFLDNFSLEGFELDYEALSQEEIVNTTVTESILSLDYQVLNTGELNGSPSTTTFYWSEDDILDSNDFILNTLSESYLSPDNLYTGNNTFNIPQPINQGTYYIFYKADANEELEETNEENNVGSFIVNFSDFTSISHLENSGIQIFSTENTLNINSTNSKWVNQPLNLAMYSMDGKLIFLKNIIISQGNNQYPLPDNLASGIYNISLRNQKSLLSLEIRHTN